MKTRLKYKHTTTVPVKRTAAQVTELLAEIGASGVHHRIENREIVGIDFSVLIGDQSLMYRMPIRWEPVFQGFLAEFDGRKRRRALGEKEREKILDGLQQQARRVAWRLALEWLKVNLAFVETGARDAIEVFMPDLIVPDTDETLDERMIAGGLQALLPPPKAGK